MSRESSARYFHKNKEKVKESLVEGIKEEKNKKNDIRISQKMKSKN